MYSRYFSGGSRISTAMPSYELFVLVILLTLTGILIIISSRGSTTSNRESKGKHISYVLINIPFSDRLFTVPL